MALGRLACFPGAWPWCTAAHIPPWLGSATEAQGAGAQLQGSGSQAALGMALSPLVFLWIS